MASVLDNVDVILANGDLEVFRQWIEVKLELKDRQITHLLHRIQKLEDRCILLESALNNKPDKNELYHRIDELHQIFKYRYEN